ncbi:MAG: hypothetical protein KC931_05070 [Candidatus Omnitrophica bacterium]|nr:hypothetical protein [Candidatus Omnitrophota bacterium]MCA9435536.1 hypothetical protein [Candidatus Omnitrophota bacterium]MCA9446464.1 hypothetical protein [Candidatus Omnitrophota bacterium]
MKPKADSHLSTIHRIRFPYTLLLVFLILLLVVYPYLETWKGDLALTGILFAITLSCIYSVSGNRNTLWIGIALSLPALLQRFGEVLAAEPVGGRLYLPYRELYSLPLYFFIVYNILRDILTHSRVTSETLRAAVCLYLLLGIIWTSFYVTAYELDHNSFRGVEGISGEKGVWRSFLFFSFVTLTTLGYGDITPVHDTARSLVILEAVCGVLFIAILISKLVSMYGRVDEKSE